MAAEQKLYEQWNCKAEYTPKDGETTHNVEDYTLTPTSKVIGSHAVKISDASAAMLNLQSHNTKIMYVLAVGDSKTESVEEKPKKK